MNSLMYSQGGAMAKSLPTHITFVRSLSSMHSLMLSQPYVIGKSLPTINTIKGFLSSMVVAPMACKRSILPESLLTVNTLVRSPPTVSPTVMS
jgi:hypothetical protein